MEDSYQKLNDSITTAPFTQIYSDIQEFLAPLLQGIKKEQKDESTYGVACTKFLYSIESRIPKVTATDSALLAQIIQQCCKCITLVKDELSRTFKKPLTVERILSSILFKVLKTDVRPGDVLTISTLLYDFLIQPHTIQDKETANKINQNGYTLLWNAVIKWKKSGHGLAVLIPATLQALRFYRNYNPDIVAFLEKSTEVGAMFCRQYKTEKANEQSRGFIVDFYREIILTMKNIQQPDTQATLITKYTEFISSYSDFLLVTGKMKMIVHVREETAELLENMSSHFTTLAITLFDILLISHLVKQHLDYFMKTHSNEKEVVFKLLDMVKLVPGKCCGDELINATLSATDKMCTAIQQTVRDRIQDGSEKTSFFVKLIKFLDLLDEMFTGITTQDLRENTEILLISTRLYLMGNRHLDTSGKECTDTLARLDTIMQNIVIDSDTEKVLNYLGYVTHRIATKYFNKGKFNIARCFYKAMINYQLSYCQADPDKYKERCIEVKLSRNLEMLIDSQRKCLDIKGATDTIVQIAPLDSDAAIVHWLKVQRDAAKLTTSKKTEKRSLYQELVKRDVVLEKRQFEELLRKEVQQLIDRKLFTDMLDPVSDYVRLCTGQKKQAWGLLQKTRALWATKQPFSVSSGCCNKGIGLLEDSELDMVGKDLLAQLYIWLYVISEDDFVAPKDISLTAKTNQAEMDETPDVVAYQGPVSNRKMENDSMESLDKSLALLHEVIDKNDQKCIQKNLNGMETFTSLEIMASIYRFRRKPLKEYEAYTIMHYIAQDWKSSSTVQAVTGRIQSLLSVNLVSEALVILPEQLSTDDHLPAAVQYAIVRAELYMKSDQVLTSSEELAKLTDILNKQTSTYKWNTLKGLAKLVQAELSQLPLDDKLTADNTAVDLLYEASRKLVSVANCVLGTGAMAKSCFDSSTNTVDKWAVINNYLHCLHKMGTLQIQLGDEREAKCYLKEGLRTSQGFKLTVWMSEFLLALAKLDCLRNDPREAQARLDTVKYMLTSCTQVKHQSKPGDDSKTNSSVFENSGDDDTFIKSHDIFADTATTDSPYINNLSSPSLKRQTLQLPEYAMHSDTCDCFQCADHVLHVLNLKLLHVQSWCILIQGKYQQAKMVAQLGMKLYNRVSPHFKVHIMNPNLSPDVTTEVDLKAMYADAVIDLRNIMCEIALQSRAHEDILDHCVDAISLLTNYSCLCIKKSTMLPQLQYYQLAQSLHGIIYSEPVFSTKKVLQMDSFEDNSEDTKPMVLKDVTNTVEDCTEFQNTPKPTSSHSILLNTPVHKVNTEGCDINDCLTPDMSDNYSKKRILTEEEEKIDTVKPTRRKAHKTRQCRIVFNNKPFIEPDTPKPSEPRLKKSGVLRDRNDMNDSPLPSNLRDPYSFDMSNTPELVKKTGRRKTVKESDTFSKTPASNKSNGVTHALETPTVSKPQKSLTLLLDSDNDKTNTSKRKPKPKSAASTKINKKIKNENDDIVFSSLLKTNFKTPCSVASSRRAALNLLLADSDEENIKPRISNRRKVSSAAPVTTVSKIPARRGRPPKTSVCKGQPEPTDNDSKPKTRRGRKPKSATNIKSENIIETMRQSNQTSESAEHVVPYSPVKFADEVSVENEWKHDEDIPSPEICRANDKLIKRGKGRNSKLKSKVCNEKALEECETARTDSPIKFRTSGPQRCEMTRQFTYDKADNKVQLSSAEVKEKLLHILSSVEHFPPPHLYKELYHSLAMLCIDEEPDKAARYLAESMAVTNRHNIIANIGRKLRSLKKNTSYPKDLSKLNTVRNIVQFSSSNVQPLDKLPPEYTVCQLSVLSPIWAETASLVLTQYRATSSPLVIKLPGFSTPQGKALVEEFNSILVGNIETMKETVKKKWWEMRGRLDTRMKELLQDVEDTWFDEWRGALLGQLVDSDKAATLDKAAREILDEEQVDTQWLQILIDSGHLLSKKQLVSAVKQMMKLNSRETTEIVGKIMQQNKLLCSDNVKRHPVILVLDKEIQHLPVESLPALKAHPVCRMPSLAAIRALLYTESYRESPVFYGGVDTNLSYYILNPDSNLPGTQGRFEDWFKKEASWGGIIDRVPTKEEFTKALVNHDLFIYCGHGSGSKYLAGDSIQSLDCKATSMLMGCSSGKLTAPGQLEANGIVMHYLLAGCPCIVGCLWDVTDKDIDKYTLKMLQTWLAGSSDTSLCEVACEARTACKMEYMVGSAPVVYGLPISIKK